MVHSHARSGAAARAQFARMLAINNEMLRVTNGQPHLYEQGQLEEIKRQIIQEQNERADMVFQARFKNRIHYFVGGGLFLLIALIAIIVQAVADITKDESVDDFSGFM